MMVEADHDEVKSFTRLHERLRKEMAPLLVKFIFDIIVEINKQGVLGGKIIGAIGVSGGSGSQDDAVSQAGAAALK